MKHLIRLPLRGFAIGLTCLCGGSSVALSASPFLSIGNQVDLFVDSTVTYQYTTNVFNDATEEGDNIFIFSPGIEAVFGRNALTSGTLRAVYNIAEYTDNSQANSDNLNISFAGNRDGDRLDINVNASFEQISQNTNTIIGGQILGDLVDREILSAGTRLSYQVSEKISTSAGVQFLQTEYKNFQASFNDQQSITIPVRAFYAVTPKIDLGGTYRYRTTEVDPTSIGTGGTDREDHFIGLSVRGELFPKLTGAADFGATHRTFDGNVDSTTTFTVGSDFSYQATPKLSFGLLLDRDFETGGAGSSIETTSATLTGFYQIDPRLAANASIGYELDEFDRLAATNREDDTINASVGLNYNLNRYFRFGANYSYTDLESDAAGIGFSAHNISLTAGVRY